MDDGVERNPTLMCHTRCHILMSIMNGMMCVMCSHTVLGSTIHFYLDVNFPNMKSIPTKTNTGSSAFRGNRMGSPISSCTT